MTDEQLDQIFKAANEISYQAALRAVYDAGFADGSEGSASPDAGTNTTADETGS